MSPAGISGEGPDPAAQAPLRLGIVDDHEVFRLGLRSLLERLGPIEIAWDTSSAHDAWRRIESDPVDAVLVDVNLGGPVDGLEAARVLTSRDPQLRVILMSGLVDERRLAAAREVGAIGFLPKDLSADEMVDSLRVMVRPRAGRRLPGARLRFQEDRVAPLEALSRREVEVLSEIRLGRTNREIAEKLRVSTHTVNKHVHQVLRKLRVRNRAEAAIVAATLLSRPRI